MKNRIWLFQLPIILLFSAAFMLSRDAEQGKLQNPILRDAVYPVLRNISGAFTNAKFLARGPIPPQEKVVIVEIDSESLDTLGRWPWHRDVTAVLIDRIFKSHPKVVGLDMVFSEPDERVPQELRTVLENQGMGDLANQFESDLVLEQVIRTYGDRLVLGWTTESSCRPSYVAAETECPVGDPEKLYHPEDPERQAKLDYRLKHKKFGYQHVKFPESGFHPLQTPIVSLLYYISNLPMYNEAASHSGFFNAFPDPDGYIRRTSLVMIADNQPLPSLALEMARVGLDEEIYIELDDGYRVKELGFAKNKRPIPITPLGSMEINFRGPAYTFPYVSALQVLTDDNDLQIGRNRELASTRSDLFTDAYVLVGISALGSHDMRAFAFDSNTPGVEGHATILDNILSQKYLVPGSAGTGSIVILFLMTVLAATFAYATERLESVPALLLFLLVMGGLGGIDQKILFESYYVNLNSSLVYLEFFAVFVFTLAAKYVLEEKNKKFIKGAFAKYVAPSIVDTIIKDPTKLTVGGEKRDLTIMFSDIRSFTTFSEKMDAKALSQFLNEYLGQMTEIIFECEGTLDKYIGDAVMAFWGAPIAQPAHAVNACKTAVLMLRKLDELRPHFMEKYGMDVQVGIGLNSGAVSVGNMGSDRIFSYTVIGDHVNLASRLEGLTKYYGVRIVTTRFTFDEISNAGGDLPPHRTLDLVKVKGKKNAVELIQILENETDAQGLDLFNEGRSLYSAMKWDEAVAKFELANEKLRKDSDDYPCRMYIDRCLEFKANPPADGWDGSWEMTSK